MTPLQAAVSKVEAKATEVISANASMMVPWFLMLSYLYYVHDISPTSDEFFDQLCKRLHSVFDDLEHRHKYMIDKDALRAGTGYYLKFDGPVGSVIAGGARALLSEFMPWELNNNRNPKKKRRKPTCTKFASS